MQSSKPPSGCPVKFHKYAIISKLAILFCLSHQYKLQCIYAKLQSTIYGQLRQDHIFCDQYLSNSITDKLHYWQASNTEWLGPSVALSIHHLAHGSLVLRQPSTPRINADNYYTELKYITVITTLRLTAHSNSQW